MRAHATWARLAAPLLVLGLALKTAWGMRGTVDVELDDESIYLDGARHLHDHYLPLAESSPLYPAWYRLLAHFQPDAYELYYLNWLVLALALPLLLYALARRSGASLGSAATVAVVWSFSGALLVNPFVSKFAVLLLGAGALAATAVKDRKIAVAFGSLAVSLAAYARAELLLPSYAFALAVAVAAVLGRRFVVSAVVLAFPAALRAVFGEPQQSWRAFFAFGQHYAKNVVAARHLQVDPWTSWEGLVRADFPHATTVVSALRENPSAFGWHVGQNAMAIPRELVQVIGPLKHIPLWLTVLAMVALAVIALAALLRRAMVGSLEAWAPLFAVVALTTLGSSLVIHPREHVLLPLVWLSFAALAGMAGHVVPPLVRPRLRGGVQVATLGLLAALLPARPAARPREAAQTILALRALGLKPKVVILETSYSRAIYANVEFERVGQSEKREGFWAFVRRRNVGVIVIDDRLRQDARFASDPEFQRFLAGPSEREGEREDFDFIPVETTAVVLAVRKRLR